MLLLQRLALLFHLTTQRHSLVFDVATAGACLREPELPELKGLLGQFMPPTSLLRKLAACGMVLTPKDDDATKLAEPVTPKDESLESDFFEAVSPLLARYMLAPSRWNQSRGPKKCTIRLAPVSTDTYDEPAEEGEAAKKPTDPYAAVGDWPALEYVYRKAIMISALDSDAQCDDSALKGTVAHTTPLECLKGEDPEVADVLNSSSRLYQDSARQLFSALRLLSFTRASSGLTQ